MSLHDETSATPGHQPIFPTAIFLPSMKTNRILLILAASLGWSALSPAQTISTGLPSFISYQGKVLNSSGGLVGTGTPVNRTVTFRIWNHPSNTLVTNLIYSETQTVTITEGEFSVLVGQGVATTATTQFGYNETAKGPQTSSIANAFNGSSRFLAVTVDDGTVAVDNEISPRQQVVSSAFAFRSKFAETLGTANSTAMTAVDSGNIGVGNANPTARFTVTGANTSTSSSTPQLLITADIPDNAGEQLRIGLDSTNSGTGFLQAFKEGLGPQSLLLNPNGGFVGVGRTGPEVALDVSGVIRANDGTTGPPANGIHGGTGQRFILFPGSAATTPFGFGIDNATLWSVVPTTASFKWYEGTVEKMRLSGGNLGIGNTAPAGRLHLGEATGTVRSENAGSIVLDHENAGGASSIVFRSKTNRGGDYGYLQYQDAAALGGIGEAAVLTLGISNDPDDHIALMPAGNVGVGTTSPTHRLQVAGVIAARGTTLTNGYSSLTPGTETQAGYLAIHRPNDVRMGYLGWEPTNLTLQLENNANFVINNGNVGIGTSPTLAKLHVSGGPTRSGIYGSYINGAVASNAVTHGAHIISIVAESTIWAGGTVIASSDGRIKNIQGHSNSAVDLQTLMGIEITDYHYKDLVAKGDASQKKVIAQQVEKVFPQAIAMQTEVIPDIFKSATLKDHWVELATDLKKGERVRLIAEGKEGIHEVLEVKKGMFRTDFDPTAETSPGADAAKARKSDGKVFVYGREVNDFRTVDYDAIAMLNVSATQELKKEMDAKLKVLGEENAALRAKLTAFEAHDQKREGRMADLENKDKARETRLAAIEKLLQSPDKNASRPVSFKKPE